MRCSCGHGRYRNGSEALLRWHAEPLMMRSALRWLGVHSEDTVMS
jgi:hypothetical protein